MAKKTFFFSFVRDYFPLSQHILRWMIMKCTLCVVGTCRPRCSLSSIRGKPTRYKNQHQHRQQHTEKTHNKAAQSSRTPATTTVISISTAKKTRATPKIQSARPPVFGSPPHPQGIRATRKLVMVKEPSNSIKPPVKHHTRIHAPGPQRYRRKEKGKEPPIAPQLVGPIVTSQTPQERLAGK